MGLWDSVKTGASAAIDPVGFGAGRVAGTDGWTVSPLASGAFKKDGAIGSQFQEGGIFNKSGLSPIRRSKEMLKADIDRLNTDPESLGLSPAQRETAISEATQGARTGAQGQISQLSRDALSGQGFQAGEFQQAQQNVAGQVQDAAVQAAPQVTQLHQQLINQEKSRILGDLDEQRERARENAQFWAQFGINGMATFAEIGAQAMGSVAEAGGMAAMASRAEFKENIVYLTDEDKAKLAEIALSTPLASWEYKPEYIGDGMKRIGLIIDDNPDHPSVEPAKRAVDLYTYASMALVAAQALKAEVDALKAEIAELKAPKETKRGKSG